MTPEEIIDAYNVVSQDVQNYTAEQAAAIGNSQRSLGTLAERVASPSGQTSGLANYTYNRTLRPTVDTLTADLVAQGKSRGLENYLNAKLREARNKYEDAQNRYTVASTTPKKTEDPNKNKVTEEELNGFDGKKKETNTGSSVNTDQGTLNQNSLIENSNAYNAATGGGQLPTNTTASRFKYVDSKGITHNGYMYYGQGGSIDGMDFTKEGMAAYISKKANEGAKFYNTVGKEVDGAILKMQYKLY